MPAQPLDESTKKSFLTEDLYDALRWLFVGALTWAASKDQPHRCGNQDALAMFTSLTQARALYEFFYGVGEKDDDARARHFASAWDPPKTDLYRRYMAGGKPANKRVFHLVYNRPKRKRARTGSWGNKPVWIEADPKKAKFQIRVPNARSWAASVTQPLSQIIKVSKLPTTLANPVAEVTVRPVVGGNPEAVMTLDEFRREWPLLRTSFLMAEELYERSYESGKRGRIRDWSHLR